mmetsp:Transcript_14213/g.33959  ORF Transcript_14213/g.33959 Transcript_14213/m.33959 type:complete len:200 (-) Transcript_14213:218-817(-)
MAQHEGLTSGTELGQICQRFGLPRLVPPLASSTTQSGRSTGLLGLLLQRRSERLGGIVLHVVYVEQTLPVRLGHGNHREGVQTGPDDVGNLQERRPGTTTASARRCRELDIYRVLGLLRLGLGGRLDGRGGQCRFLCGLLHRLGLCSSGEGGSCLPLVLRFFVVFVILFAVVFVIRGESSSAPRQECHRRLCRAMRLLT